MKNDKNNRTPLLLEMNVSKTVKHKTGLKPVDPIFDSQNETN